MNWLGFWDSLNQYDYTVIIFIIIIIIVRAQVYCCEGRYTSALCSRRRAHRSQIYVICRLSKVESGTDIVRAFFLHRRRNQHYVTASKIAK